MATNQPSGLRISPDAREFVAGVSAGFDRIIAKARHMPVDEAERYLAEQREHYGGLGAGESEYMKGMAARLVIYFDECVAHRYRH